MIVAFARHLACKIKAYKWLQEASGYLARTIHVPWTCRTLYSVAATGGFPPCTTRELGRQLGFSHHVQTRYHARERIGAKDASGTEWPGCE